MSPGQILSDIDSDEPEDAQCCSNVAGEGVSSTLFFVLSQYFKPCDFSDNKS